jgi:tetratricopeptide (TPR) repeat protein
MPSHIYILVGDYHKAAKSNEEAIAVDRAYIPDYGVQGVYPVHYLSHNLYFLSRAYIMEGNFAGAKRVADELNAFYDPHFKMMPDLEYYIPAPLFVFLRFHKWNEVLELPQPNSDSIITNVLWHFARRVAAAATVDLKTAFNQQRLFLEGKNKLTLDKRYGYNQASVIMKIAENVLAAKIAEAQNQIPEAIAFLQEAIATQDRML